jgi:hypothetical protein
MRIVVLFNLRGETDRAAYEKWAKDVDAPAVNGLPSIGRFTVHRCASVLGSDASPPYQYVETLDVKDPERFGADVATDTMKRIASEFQAFADNPIFVVTEPVAG